MKKILLLILCLMMIGCSQAESVAPPKILLEDTYDSVQSFKIEDAFSYDDPLVVTINGQSVESEFELVIGEHKIEVFTVKDDVESEHVTKTVVVKGQMITLYDQINGQAFEIEASALNQDMAKKFYHVQNDLWTYVESEYFEGYIKDFALDLDLDHIFVCDNKEINVSGKITYQHLNGYYVYSDGQKNHLINAVTGDVLSHKNLHVSPEGHQALIIEDDIILYDLLMGQIKTVTQMPWTYETPWQVAFLGDGISIITKLGDDLKEYKLINDGSWHIEALAAEGPNTYEVYPSRSVDSVYNESISAEALEEAKVIKYLSLTEEGLVLWLEVPEKGYVKMPYEGDDYDYVCDSDGYQIKGVHGYIENISSESFSQDGYYLLDDGPLTLVYNTHDNLLTSLDQIIDMTDHIVVSKKVVSDRIVFVIYSYDQGFVPYEQAFENTGEVYVEIISDDEVIVSLMTTSQDPWVSVDYYQSYYETFHMKRVDDGFVNTYPSIEMSVQVYESMEKTSPVGTLDIGANEVSFLNTYDLIDDQLVLWFKVGQYYAYRPLRYGEVPIHSPQSPIYQFILTDGTIVEMLAEEDLEYIRIENDLQDKGYFTNFSSYEWYIGDFINANTGQHFRVDGTPVLSEDESLMYAVEYLYGSDEAVIHLYEFSPEAIDKIGMFEVGLWQPQITWVEDRLEIVLSKYDSDEIRHAVLEQVNNEWIYKIIDTE
jgi:hypothetical protein